jgi:GSH-dependent disulfide-bond oxidoreductase
MAATQTPLRRSSAQVAVKVIADENRHFALGVVRDEGDNRSMIDLYFWPTPNGHKISIFLEEAQVPYKMIPVNIGKGDQFLPEFLAISPNNRMPAIVDHEPNLSTPGPLALFESGAILLYLADKYRRFIPQESRGRQEVVQWLMWQMGGLGPMLGQNHHFSQYAPEKIPYAIDRYTKETARLYGVLNKRLADRAYVAGSEISIADMAIAPWILPALQGQKIEDFPHISRYLKTLAERPRWSTGATLGNELRAPMSDEARKVLFGQK